MWSNIAGALNFYTNTQKILARDEEGAIFRSIFSNYAVFTPGPFGVKHNYTIIFVLTLSQNRNTTRFFLKNYIVRYLKEPCAILSRIHRVWGSANRLLVSPGTKSYLVHLDIVADAIKHNSF